MIFLLKFIKESMKFILLYHNFKMGIKCGKIKYKYRSNMICDN